MCKTIKCTFDKSLTFEKLLSAHKRASKGKKLKDEIIIFEMDLETNLIKLMKDIKYNRYKVGNYREFVIYEPKKRIIKSLPYRDRIIHQWYIEEFIKPFMVKRFINDTYACLDNRGTLSSALKTQKYMRRMQKKYNNYYVLQCDIKKFFYSIDKKILLSILNRIISDKKLMAFTKIILDDGTDIGIPIGNYTSQYFANIYLNELDHFVKEKLRVKYYIRYMDDFILLVKNKSEAKYFFSEISKFLKDNLALELNQKSRYYPSSIGIDFCGYRIFETHLLLRKRFKKKVKKTLKKWKNSEELNSNKLLLSWNSIKAHARHANSYNFLLQTEVDLRKILEEKNITI